MKRTPLLAAAVAVELAAPMALPPVATAAGTDTISGTVVDVVHEGQDERRGPDQHELVLIGATGGLFRRR